MFGSQVADHGNLHLACTLLVGTSQFLRLESWHRNQPTTHRAEAVRTLGETTLTWVSNQVERALEVGRKQIAESAEIFAFRSCCRRNVEVVAVEPHVRRLGQRRVR